MVLVSFVVVCAECLMLVTLGRETPIKVMTCAGFFPVPVGCEKSQRTIAPTNAWEVAPHAWKWWDRALVP